jgi:hypothetical protein
MKKLRCPFEPRFASVVAYIAAVLKAATMLPISLAKEMAPVKGPSSMVLIVVMMATMLNHDHVLSTMITPAAVVVSSPTHFDTHTASVMVAVTMHFAPVSVTVVAITANSDAHLFGACNGRSSNCNSCEGCKNVRQLFHRGFPFELDVRRVGNRREGPAFRGYLLVFMNSRSGSLRSSLKPPFFVSPLNNSASKGVMFLGAISPKE